MDISKVDNHFVASHALIENNDRFLIVRRSGNNHIEYKWVDKEEISNLDVMPYVKDLFIKGVLR